MKKIKQIFVSTIVFFLVLGISHCPVSAAGVSVSGNKSSVTIGSTFNVTVKADDCYATISASCSNGTISGGASDADNTSVTFTVKPASVGSCSVTISGTYAAYTGSSTDVNYSKSVTVSVNAKATQSSSSSSSSKPSTPTVDTRSKENALSSLTVSEGTLSPDFNASTTKYTVNVEGDKTKITFNAKAKDSKASVSGTGEKDLKVGKNTFVIKCTAENGSSRNYTIDVNVDEKPVVYTTLNDMNLGVVRNLTEVNGPSGFEKTTSQIEGHDVDAWVNEKLGLTICYLVDDNDKKAFYVVEEGKPIYELVRVEIDGRNFIVTPIDEQLKEREGFTFQKISVKELELDGWVYNDQAYKNYVQIYLLNENGQKYIYDYETTEDQLQIYTEATKIEEFNVFIISTALLAVGCVGLLGFILYNRKRKMK